MEKILFVNTCVRQDSRTLRLAKRLLEKLKGDITEVRPDKDNIAPLCEGSLYHRDKLIASESFDAEGFAYARDFAAADIIVIAAPYWDLSFPALLKIYAENINVCGITFRYDENGVPISLCRAKTLYYITTAGGPIVHNMGFDYIRALAENFYGIKDIRFISAEGLDIYGADVEKILAEAENKIDML